MSHAAFLAAIREHPDADLPRLVFADWLDENGDPARAEFIRVQCELASLPDHHPQFRALEDREHELLSEHEPAWAGELPGYATEWDWRRGFVDDVTLRLEDYAHADEAVEGHAVTRLSLSSNGDFDARVGEHWRGRAVIAGAIDIDFSRIRSPQVLGTVLVIRAIQSVPDLPNIRGWGMAGVVPLPLLRFFFYRQPHLPRLTHLTFGETPVPGGEENEGNVGFEPEQFNQSLTSTHLKSLSLDTCTIFTADLRELLQGSWSESLTHLDISGNPLAPDAYQAFDEARPGMRLQSLDVSGTPLAGISLEPLLSTPTCESLTKLEMNGCGSARRNMEVLSRSRFWTQATELRAHSGTIPASTLEPLCGSSGPPALRLLDLADNYLRTEGVRMLCDAPWTEPLTWLALSRNYLDDDSCRALANSRLRHLRTLHLAHNNLTQDRSDGEVITDIGVSWLTDSQVLANLRLLTLSYTGISDRSVDLVLNRAPWRLFGLGIAGNNLTGETVRILATSPRLARLVWLDISGNPRLGGRALLPLAESPYLSRLCELDCGGIAMAPEVRQAFRERLGSRFSD